MSFTLLKLNAFAQSEKTLDKKIEVEDKSELLPEIRKLFLGKVVKRLSDDYYELISGRKTIGYIYAY